MIAGHRTWAARAGVMVYGISMDDLRQINGWFTATGDNHQKKKKTSGIFMDIPEYAGGGRYQNRN